MSKIKRIAAIATFLALQIAAIGWLIVRYERIVSFGTEIRFKCAAYDPYDPLRGRYLRTTVEETTDNIPKSISNDCYSVCNHLFVVRVEPSTNGLWRVAEAAFEPTAEGVWVKPESSQVNRKLSYSDRGKDESDEDFLKRSDAAGFVLSATFPGQFFLNEKLAPKAEKLLRERMRDAVAVYRVLNGEIVITDIEIDGESILDKVR